MGMMAKQTKYIIGFIVLTIFMLVLTPKMVKVEAAEIDSKEIPIEISLDGSPPEIAEDYEVILKADNINNPMPKGSAEGKFSLTIKGAGATKIPEITFSSIGVYKYQIFQKAKNNVLASYDDSVYNLTVYVTNRADKNGFETNYTLYLVNGTEKYDGAAFNNSYEREELPFTGGDKIPEEKDKLPETGKERDKLPQTGDNVKSMTFYGTGIFLMAVGLLVGKKRKEDNKA